MLIEFDSCIMFCVDRESIKFYHFLGFFQKEILSNIDKSGNTKNEETYSINIDINKKLTVTRDN